MFAVANVAPEFKPVRVRMFDNKTLFVTMHTTWCSIWEKTQREAGVMVACDTRVNLPDPEAVADISPEFMEANVSVVGGRPQATQEVGRRIERPGRRCYLAVAPPAAWKARRVHVTGTGLSF